MKLTEDELQDLVRNPHLLEQKLRESGVVVSGWEQLGDVLETDLSFYYFEDEIYDLLRAEEDNDREGRQRAVADLRAAVAKVRRAADLVEAELAKERVPASDEIPF